MTKFVTVGVFATAAWALLATPSFAGFVPAPVLGAGPAGLAILALGGAAYVAVRLRRRRKD